MNNRSYLLLSVFVAMLVVFQSSCKKPDIKMNTTDDVNIVGYLEKNIDSFSLFKQILDRTDNSAFLNAYGSYTVFAPVNSGVKAWLTSVGATSVETADLNTLKELVKFHVLEDTVTTGSFKDGKLPVATIPLSTLRWATITTCSISFSCAVSISILIVERPLILILVV